MNTDDAEADLAALDSQELIERLPSKRVRIARSSAEAIAAASSGPTWTDLAGPLLLAMLILLTLESLFANRFYRSESTTQTP